MSQIKPEEENPTSDFWNPAGKMVFPAALGDDLVSLTTDHVIFFMQFGANWLKDEHIRSVDF